MIPLSGLTINELAQALNELPAYRAKQIFQWIARGAHSFEEMSNLPHELRATLAEKFCVRQSKVNDTLSDKDGTVKLKLCLSDNLMIESVLLASLSEDTPSSELIKPRLSACLSTQAGCPIGCVFCKTGSMGFTRNLAANEIVEQYLFLSDHAKKEMNEKISHIVVMGMGEPLLNLDALRKALDILCDSTGINLSKRKITISTCGISSGILEMAETGPDVELALSLTSAREDLRKRLMPGTSGNPLTKVKEALRHYQKKQGRRITLEMVLLRDINTSTEEAKAAAAFAKGLSVVVNLIPWNPVEGLRFEGKYLQKPEENEITNFKNVLEHHGLTVTRRYRRGRGIAAACGQLGEKEK